MDPVMDSSTNLCHSGITVIISHTLNGQGHIIIIINTTQEQPTKKQQLVIELVQGVGNGD
eukprot:m.137470 g.137470  ORF g.137470 m.137470 type:complete len:60 (-) comp9929_c0_seq8:1427-1606(-)